MKLYKRCTKWYADLRSEGLGRVATGCTDKSEARAVAKRLIEGGKAGHTVRDALELATVLYARTKNSRVALAQAAELEDVIGDAKLDAITGLTISRLVAFLRAGGNTDATISRKLAVLYRAFELAISNGWMNSKPDRPRLKGSRVRHRELTNSEVSRLIQGTAGRNRWARGLWFFLLDTGARLSEALRLTELDRMDGIKTGQVRFRDTKNGKDRVVPLTSRAREALLAWQWKGKSPAQCRAAWEYARWNMMLHQDKGFVIHALRHTCASRLLQGGVRLEVVSMWLGHSSLQVTQRYAHLSTACLAEGRGVLEGGLLQGPSGEPRVEPKVGL